MHNSSKSNTVHSFQPEGFTHNFPWLVKEKKKKAANVHLACCAWEYLQPEMTDEREKERENE